MCVWTAEGGFYLKCRYLLSPPRLSLWVWTMFGFICKRVISNEWNDWILHSRTVRAPCTCWMQPFSLPWNRLLVQLLIIAFIWFSTSITNSNLNHLEPSTSTACRDSSASHQELPETHYNPLKYMRHNQHAPGTLCVRARVRLCCREWCLHPFITTFGCSRCIRKLRLQMESIILFGREQKKITWLNYTV